VRERLQKPLEGKTGRIIEDIRAFLTDVLGNPKLDESAMLASWSGLLAELSRLSCPGGSTCRRRERDASDRRVWGAALRATAAAGRWRATSTNSFPSTGNRIGGYGGSPLIWPAIDSQDEFKKLARVRTDLEHDLARAYHDIAVRRTWLEAGRECHTERPSRHCRPI
jgi:hypothetical protein